jgi:UTP--glucose-1-phosphate uridylyltransferase
MPKEMLPVVDKPVIQYIVEEVIEAGIRNVVFVTGKHKRAIEDHFDTNKELELHLESSGKLKLLEEIRKISSLLNPIYVRQKEQRGLGHAVLMAKPLAENTPFVVSLGDIIIKGLNSVSLMKEIYNQFGRSVIALFEVPREEVSKYGIAKVKQIGDIVEKPSPEEAPSNLAVVGRYLFTPTLWKHLENTPPGKGGEIQLTDAIRSLLEEEEVYAFTLEPSLVYDTGNKLDYLKTVITFALEREDIGKELKEFLKQII